MIQVESHSWFSSSSSFIEHLINRKNIFDQKTFLKNVLKEHSVALKLNSTPFFRLISTFIQNEDRGESFLEFLFPICEIDSNSFQLFSPYGIMYSIYLVWTGYVSWPYVYLWIQGMYNCNVIHMEYPVFAGYFLPLYYTQTHVKDVNVGMYFTPKI